MAILEDNIRLVRNVIDALNTGDTSRVSDFISPNFFNHESQMDPVRSKMRGPQEFIDTVVNIRKAFSDLQYELTESIASNEKVISIVSVRGKHTRELFWIHSTNREQNILSSCTYFYY